MTVSVIIPCHNVRDYVGATLNSLLAQTHPLWTAIVIDDGSTDGTADLVRDYMDPRIRLVRQANQGVSAARNHGIALAGGEAILFLDADDWLAADALARMTACLETGSAQAAYGAFCFVTEDGSRVVATKPGPFPAGDIIERLLVENLFANGGHLLIRASAIRQVGLFRADLRFGEDWEYWCRLAASGPIATVPGAEPLLFVRQRGTGAYLRMATDPDAFGPCTAAIFGNPALVARFGTARVPALRRRTDAENGWIVGRELIRHGRRHPGLRALRRSFGRRPLARRAVLLLIAHLLPLLPPIAARRIAGPFRPYAG
ncbi:glycosyltransferase family 2 protein [Lichenicoccus sp.]|uniref:glycosyltransferase family 2 protein n=1 Tax=Lichenicoccus sp. TaxID=2781899 RepID=UPI003D120EA9